MRYESIKGCFLEIKKEETNVINTEPIICSNFKKVSILAPQFNDRIVENLKKKIC